MGAGLWRMRAPRAQRVRSLSDTDLETALIDELVDWLTTPGTTTPPARLQSLYGAYRRRFGGHTAGCVCETCFEAYPLDALEL